MRIGSRVTESGEDPREAYLLFSQALPVLEPNLTFKISTQIETDNEIPALCVLYMSGDMYLNKYIH